MSVGLFNVLEVVGSFGNDTRVALAPAAPPLPGVHAWGIWSGVDFGSRDLLTSMFSYEDDAVEGRFLSIGPIVTATQDSAVSLFVDDSLPVVAAACTHGTNVHRLAFYGVAPVARAAHPVTLADVITLLTNLGLCQ